MQEHLITIDHTDSGWCASFAKARTLGEHEPVGFLTWAWERNISRHDFGNIWLPVRRPHLD